MALTYTPNDSLGMLCPDFKLPATDGNEYQLSDFSKFDVLCFLFICNHCPYVQAIEHRIINLNKALEGKPIQILAICSNDATEYPEDSFENIKLNWQKKNYNFPYLYDESQTVAKSFGAVCTPDIFVFNKDRKLTYRGRFDDSWKNPQQVTREELRTALFETLENKPISFEPIPSMGCSIKWK